MSSIINSAAFLRTSRDFPEDLHMGFRETNKAYIEIAQKVNERIIGLFTTSRPSVNGESWFLTNNQRQQAFRQVYPITGTGNYAHGIPGFAAISNFVKIYGEFFDGTFWQTLPYVDVLSATNQINLKVDATNIVITAGAGAPPTIVKGTVVLEWLSNP